MPVNEMLNFKFNPIPEVSDEFKRNYKDDLADYTAEQINTACENAIKDFDPKMSDQAAFDAMMQIKGRNRTTCASGPTFSEVMGIVIPRPGIDPLDAIMVFYVNVGDRNLGEAENYLFEFKERYCEVLNYLPKNYRVMLIPVRSQPTQIELIKIGDEDGKQSVAKEEYECKC
ncbi:hypothetical protein DRO91_07125 [Candidatus Heimdallarchaeota archaeon]|nr:MAG: hypothetical protein DRO91_07125 [Candidatus Heimdallarchaeota archaeon]